ncbi:hypothetical protein C9113_24740 [Escherichia coli]|nr:hypothetical protein [Escherichia coli]RNJ24293.1 hypothetical protein EFV01_23545 [Escherichia coli]TGG62289.1 hypothetical protein DAH20_19150 [Escherichia coli]TJB30221.1 hypothetical protein C9293_22970 [Escherichia coli]TJI02062.1 hypothetical protein C9143_22855 [Escherichia coli]
MICIFSVVGNANAGSGTPDWTHREAPGTMFMMIQIRSVSPSPEGLFYAGKTLCCEMLNSSQFRWLMLACLRGSC